MAAQIPPKADTDLSLVLAIIESSTAPLLLINDDFTVIAASASFCNAFHIDPVSIPGQLMFELGKGEWNVPQLRSLLKIIVSGGAPIDAYEMDLKNAQLGTRRLVVNAKKLVYGDTDHVRLLLAVTDVTDARLSDELKERLVQEKAVLLQEVQHRVANSLQIIASVLLQSAKKVQSEETRGHLKIAHGRVMSIAAVQKQLAATGLGRVALRPYFTQLCESLGASMIRDPSVTSLKVVVDDTVVSADESVSLGLIVTELVINALKHAFPDERGGKISIEFKSQNGGWTLIVRDDGIGMQTGGVPAKPGLGSGIVEALRRQLKAQLTMSQGNPGTIVSIEHLRADAAVFVLDDFPAGSGQAV